MKGMILKDDLGKNPTVKSIRIKFVDNQEYLLPKQIEEDRPEFKDKVSLGGFIWAYCPRKKDASLVDVNITWFGSVEIGAIDMTMRVMQQMKERIKFEEENR